MKKVIIFLSYGEHLPSFRHRLKGRWLALQEAGWDCQSLVLPSRRYIRRIFDIKRQLTAADAVVLSKLKLNSVECLLLQRWCSDLIYDIDDSIWLKRPKKLGDEPGRSAWRDAKFNAVCRVADAVVVGNSVLAERVLPINPSITTVPTPVDVDAYQQVEAAPDPNFITAVWIGLPGNLVFLESIRPALAAIAKQQPNFRLRIVSSRGLDWDDVPTEFLPWSIDAEMSALRSADIGLMPLLNDDWSRGKCAFKLLQYMAAGLPCVASPVGANCDAVLHGRTGYLADSVEEWKEALMSLCASPSKLMEYGAAGQQHAKLNYDRRVADTAWLELLAH